MLSCANGYVKTCYLVVVIVAYFKNKGMHASQDQLPVRCIQLQSIVFTPDNLRQACTTSFQTTWVLSYCQLLPPPSPPRPPTPLAKQALSHESLGLVRQKSSLHLLVQGMHSRDRLPTVASCLPSSLHGQAEAEAGFGGEGSGGGGGGGGGGGEQVQQDQLMHGALFQVILQQLGQPLLHITHTSLAALAYCMA